MRMEFRRQGPWAFIESSFKQIHDGVPEEGSMGAYRVIFQTDTYTSETVLFDQSCPLLVIMGAFQRLLSGLSIPFFIRELPV